MTLLFFTFTSIPFLSSVGNEVKNKRDLPFLYARLYIDGLRKKHERLYHEPILHLFCK
jgi:hypothetical protein